MKEKVLFESKEYGVGGHNKLELRVLGDGGLRIWVRDGETNALICMDRADFRGLQATLALHASKAPVAVEKFDFTKPLPHKTVTTSEANGVKKKRKPRSDKGQKRGPRKKKDNGNQ